MSAPPAGVQPLFLTTQTCELLKLRPGADVTAEQPIKQVPRAALLDDIKTRRAISDFQPFRDAIEKYPVADGVAAGSATDCLVVVYDVEWRFGQNFYICLTLTAADDVLHPKVSEADVDSAASQATTWRQGGWISLGSEREVEEEQYKPAPPSIRVELSRRRGGDLGDSSAPDDRPPRPILRDSDQQHVDLRPTPTPPHISSVTALEHNIGIQAIRPTRDSLAQTTYHAPVEVETQYEPALMDEKVALSVQQDAAFLAFLKSAEVECESALRENGMVDLLRDDYAALRNDEEFVMEKGSTMELLELQSFSDLQHTKAKSVSCMLWHPEVSQVLAMSSCLRATLDERIEQSYKIRSRQSVISFWSMTNPHKALLFLEAPDDVIVFAFHPSNANLVIAGCADGQFVIWDLAPYRDCLESTVQQSPESGLKIGLRDQFDAGYSTDATFVRHSLLCAMDGGHRGAVIDILFVSGEHCVNKSGKSLEPPASEDTVQMLTISLLGQIFVWDLPGAGAFEELGQSWRPIYKFLATSPDGTYDYGCTKALIFKNCSLDSLSKKASPPKPVMMMGTEEGELLIASWNVDYLKDKDSHVEHVIAAHHHTVSALQTSPFFEDIFATVGGTTAHLWSTLGLTGPILSYELSTHITQLCWSPSRPGVFFLGRADGTLEVWDLLDCFHAPVHTHSVSIHAISRISIRSLPPSSSGKSKHGLHYLAVGDDFGTVFVIDLPRALVKSPKNELTFIRSLANRQIERLNYRPGRPLRAGSGGSKRITALFDAQKFDRDYQSFMMASGLDAK